MFGERKKKKEGFESFFSDDRESVSDLIFLFSIQIQKKKKMYKYIILIEIIVSDCSLGRNLVGESLISIRQRRKGRLINVINFDLRIFDFQLFLEI